MNDSIPHRSKLVLMDGPGGPTPEWYLPRLCDRYDLAVLWSPSGDTSADTRKSELFSAWGCRTTAFRKDQDVVRLIKEIALSEGAEGILSFSELGVIETHTAAAELGLPANPLSSVPGMRDKYVQRRLLAEAGIPVPRFALVRSAAQLKEAYRLVGAPAIFKPVTGAGSLATYAVGPSTDLGALWETACSDHEHDERGGRTATFILEERLIGVRKHLDERYAVYASVESIVHDGHIDHLAVTDKFPLTAPFRENGGILPSVLPTRDTEELYSAASAAIIALGVTNCALHSEFMLTAEGPRVIEVNCRVGGGVSEQLYYSAGYDIIRALSDVATGRIPPAIGPFRQASAIMLPQIPARPLRVSQVPAVEDLLALPGVVNAQVNYTPGSRPQWEKGTTAGTLARIFAAAPEPSTLLATFDYLTSDKCFSYTDLDSSVG